MLAKINQAMEMHSLLEELKFSDEKISTKVILETSFSKEIRILLKAGQLMKDHKAPYPIIIHLIEGEVDFGLKDQQYLLKEGDIFSLEANVTHNLLAVKNSIVRLSLAKKDTSERVISAAAN